MVSVAGQISSKTVEPFVNTPLTDFTREENIHAQEDALRQVESEIGRIHHLIIDGERRETHETFTSVNPAHPDQVVAIFSKASVHDANDAIEAANRAFQTWQYTAAEERAGYLFEAARLMRQRRFYFNALMIYEVGKSWPEADGDTAEAIDFLEFYAREALRLAEQQPVTKIPEEENALVYIPLGAGAVIPPWNFPCAIMVGMTSASFVAGNTVVLKPASTAAWIAARFVDLLEEVGVPKGVVNFLPGPGGSIGDALVQHPLTRFIAFTGSREVGLRINELASKLQPGQIWIKRAVLEMGGKDGIVVDETADLDAAASAIVASAFGFGGEKCSACSRAIVVEPIYDTLMDKVVELTKKLSVGDTTERATYLGPVVDQNAYQKIQQYIEIGKGEGKLLVGGQALEREGYFIAPTIFGEVPPTARIAREEIFGPVLAAIKVRDFDEALAVANDTEYGLTGSIFSTDRQRIERAGREFHVGNLYINRKSTGALVGVHPFGGFNMSGTDSKAGGRDYLLLFTQAKSISEKVR
ncbi:MAG TPA: L-glutamate gamma-semialdehyde dehydrogenase [Ktedonobacterales bacterium]|jgi:1-pyrroline-5-carboxylate dehydrogenase|nr:L-glutamate gamma-semialdehyde dehydrogenase [Ktedonobacterales bacterium]